MLAALDYLNAITGKSSTKLIQKGNFIETLLGFPSENKMVTTAPLRLKEYAPDLKSVQNYRRY